MKSTFNRVGGTNLRRACRVIGLSTSTWQNERQSDPINRHLLERLTGAVGVIRSFVIERCPMCLASVAKNDWHHSQFGLAMGRYMLNDALHTTLQRCSQCRRWSLQERGRDLEKIVNGPHDFDR
jgi:hypothetical protein